MDEMRKAVEKYMWNEKNRCYCRMLIPKNDGTYEQDNTIDSACGSLWAVGAMEPSNPKVRLTMEKIRETLCVNTPIGGYARYQGDNYQRDVHLTEKIPGNPWIICGLWLAQYDIAMAGSLDELNKSLEFLNWTADHALASGVLPEQIHPLTGKPLSVSPLAWSHAAVVMTVLDYLEKWCRLSKKSQQEIHLPERNLPPSLKTFPTCGENE